MKPRGPTAVKQGAVLFRFRALDLQITGWGGGERGALRCA